MAAGGGGRVRAAGRLRRRALRRLRRAVRSRPRERGRQRFDRRPAGCEVELVSDPRLAMIRNFCIIAHIDHGKSTLADRLLEITHTLTPQQMKAQVLDDMDLEREKGITIKSHAIAMEYRTRDGQRYELNLIDTPGHVDFTYEVSRSLAACEGAILVVDASQGIEAQTLSNYFLARDQHLTIVGAINKIDLPAARPDDIALEVEHVTGVAAEQVCRISAKSGIGVEELLERVIADVPPPTGDPSAAFRALIFDSKYDSYRGVVCLIRLVDGMVRAGDRVQFISTGKEYEVTEVGKLRLKLEPEPELHAGQVGYLVAGVKTVADARVGDTLGAAGVAGLAALPGFRETKSMVFSGLYPIESEQYEELKEALSKLRLNDAALVYEQESSAALGFGFRCGFLGLLHLEIVQERLRREFQIDLIATTPSVEYQVLLTDGEVIRVDNPSLMPTVQRIESIEEPMVSAHVVTPTDYLGNVMKLCQDRRGMYLDMVHLEEKRIRVHYRLPLAEIVLDFYDRLKSISRGYASLDYEFDGWAEAAVVKLDVMLNGEPVDALSAIVHRDKAHTYGSALCSKLKELIPRQMFQVAIQAAIGGKIVARETIGAQRKNVIAKCYGGDITRKRKLLEKQKEGKRRMKQVGTVEVPQEAFLAVLKVER
ncbi:MAG: elongation factor 4 [Candidatus Eisenbacteria bacterium]|uniref:Elongation factor 4 n=1 Tax=Eiseniibacteriota bacterium TaxID=2212470 RepID=A0A849SJ30_UNCEI|nr:elongation factor 4 [Candidatus Eisenbacteria bacterium]